MLSKVLLWVFFFVSPLQQRSALFSAKTQKPSWTTLDPFLTYNTSKNIPHLALNSPNYNNKVDSVEDINEDSLTLFCILEPKIDILILGTGDNTQKFNYKLVKYLRSKGIGVEVLPTDQACATFNFLNAERRPVAAGMIPPTRISMDNEMRASAGQDIINMKFDLSDNSGPPPASELAPMLEESQKKLNSLWGRGNSESKQEQEHLKENARKHKQTENDSNNKK